jgi:hypothetical protein
VGSLPVGTGCTGGWPQHSSRSAGCGQMGALPVLPGAVECHTTLQNNDITSEPSSCHVFVSVGDRMFGILMLHPLQELGYVIPSVGNLTKENSCVNESEFPIDVMNTGNMFKIESNKFSNDAVTACVIDWWWRTSVRVSDGQYCVM